MMYKIFKHTRGILLAAHTVFFLAAAAAQELPRGYGGISLGMNRAEVEDALKKIPSFGYRGERDVSLLPSTRQMIIETQGGSTSLFGRSWFQFYEDKLCVIIITLNPERADRFSVFSTLFSKYGEPLFISPEKSEWRNNQVILSLEKPLTLKYVDVAVFERLLQQSSVEQTTAEQLYQTFLEGL
jgi:hypothetical protein